MLRYLSYGFIRSIGKYFRYKHGIDVTIRKALFSVPSKLLMSSQICCTALMTEDRTQINVEDGLIKACEEGSDAIILLMDQLKDFVLVVSREYRNCLIKQMEITKAASNLGPLSDTWGELPYYRTLADELNKELNNYITVFNTIGQMASDDSLVPFVTGNNEKLELIFAKYQELNNLLQKEFADNKEVELQLLRINRDSILKDVY